jgi:hypothetical protein
VTWGNRIAGGPGRGLQAFAGELAGDTAVKALKRF